MSTLEEQYLRLLTGGANLSALCDALSDAIGNPAALTLRTRTIIAKSHSYTEDLVTEYTETNGLLTDEEQHQQYDLILGRLKSRRAFIGLYPYLRHKHMNVGCFWRESLIGVIDVPLINSSLIDYSLEILQKSAPVFASALILRGGVPFDSVEPMESYLIGLLRGEIHDSFQQNFSYNMPFRRISEWQVTAVIPDTGQSLAKTEEALYSFCAVHQNTWCTRWEQKMVVLSDAGEENTIGKLLSICKGAHLAVSEPYKNVLETSRQLQRDLLAMRIAQFEGIYPNPVYVKNYKIPLLYLSSIQNAIPADYKNQQMDQIHKYDAEHGSSYFETLRAYLLNNMDVAKVAESMYIHRNTAAYRLQRIRELFDLDLSDCRVITSLYLALFEDFPSDVAN